MAITNLIRSCPSFFESFFDLFPQTLHPSSQQWLLLSEPVALLFAPLLRPLRLQALALPASTPSDATLQAAQRYS